jgi:hypothetical protein
VPAGEQEDLRKKLLLLVEESFTARQNWQAAQLADLRRRLGEIEQAIDHREKNKDAIIQSRLDELLSRPPAGNANRQTRPRMRYERRGPNSQRAQPQTSRVPQSESETIYDPDLDETVGQPRGAGNRTGRPEADEFDIETREQLAQLDVQGAETDLEAAKKALSIAQALHDEGAATPRNLLSAEQDFSRAEFELKRARAKLRGVARQRTELQTAAESDVLQAKAEESKAAAGVQSADAAHEAARAELDKVTAEVEAAKATLVVAEQHYTYSNKLANTGAIGRDSLAEVEKEVTTAKAALDGANASVAKAKAKARECAAAIDIARAESYRAQVHLRAATARRDRLTARDATDKHEPPTVPTSNQDGDSKRESNRQAE